jgi:hypothetical protein
MKRTVLVIPLLRLAALGVGAVVLGGCAGGGETSGDAHADQAAPAQPSLVQVGMNAVQFEEDDLDGATPDEVFDAIGANLETMRVHPVVVSRGDSWRNWRLDLGEAMRESPEMKDAGAEFGLGPDDEVRIYLNFATDGNGKFVGRSFIEEGAPFETNPEVLQFCSMLPLGVLWMGKR